MDTYYFGLQNIFFQLWEQGNRKRVQKSV